MYDLPSEDPEEPGLPDLFHLIQPRLLEETVRSAELQTQQERDRAARLRELGIEE